MCRSAHPFLFYFTALFYTTVENSVTGNFGKKATHCEFEMFFCENEDIIIRFF